MSRTRQYRHITGELRHRTEGDSAMIEGYAAKFNTYSQNLGGFVEEILPGAFENSISQKAKSDKADIRGTYNHDEIIGRQHNGTLKVAEDKTGLYFENKLNLVIGGHRDVYEKIDNGLVNGASFGFAMLDWEWSHTEDDFPLLRQKAVELFDVGPVDFPAYLDTDVDRVRMYRSYAEQAQCSDVPCFVEKAETAFAASRKFDLSTLIEAPEPVAATPLLDAARERLNVLKVR